MLEKILIDMGIKRSVLGVYIIPSNTIPNVIVLLLGAERGGTIKHFVTPNSVQAVFGPKH